MEKDVKLGRGKGQIPFSHTATTERRDYLSLGGGKASLVEEKGAVTSRVQQKYVDVVRLRKKKLARVPKG